MSKPDSIKAYQPPPQFSPPRNSPCLCGSGLNFKRCCADRLPGSEHLGTRTDEFLKAEKYNEALYACRADVTQYTIWHKSHTEPAVRRGMPKEGSLLEIDIRALGEIVNTLMWCHIKTGMMAEFPAVLERLRSNINDPEWQRKIIYFHAMHALWPDWKEPAARRELKKLGSIAEDKDVEILQLYLDLFGDDLAFSEKQDIIDRILLYSKSFTDRLHYKGSKAALYFTIGDRRKAEAELEEILAETRARTKETSLTAYQRYRFALVLDFLGIVRRDQNFFAEAAKLLQSLLKDDRYTPAGRADILGLLAESYRHKSDWENARKTYLEALAIKPTGVHKVFLCECLLQLDRPDEAATTLDQVKFENLHRAEQVDYAYALAALAIEIGERSRLENARDVLKTVSIPDPIFRERRDALLLNVQEAIVSGSSKTLIQRTRRLFAEILRSVTSYLILKPSIMGIGVDVGKVFEDMSKRSQARLKDQNSESQSTYPPQPR